MSEHKIHIKKLKTEIDAQGNVHYTSPDGKLDFNELINKEVRFRFEGEINCVVCGRKTKKTFGEGLCFPCFRDAPQNAPCILKPELCEGHLGKGRDPEWEKEHHVQPHIVYLAQTDRIKVGVTRQTQVPTRWIDQGAWKVIRLAEVPYRQLAGKIEVFLKDHFTDKTNWRNMLKNHLDDNFDLVNQKNKAAELLPDELREYVATDDRILKINYPVAAYPTKITTLNFDKHPEFTAILKGIKGQYLLFDHDRVLNFRKHSGYHVLMEW